MHGCCCLPLLLPNRCGTFSHFKRPTDLERAVGYILCWRSSMCVGYIKSRQSLYTRSDVTAFSAAARLSRSISASFSSRPRASYSSAQPRPLLSCSFSFHTRSTRPRRCSLDYGHDRAKTAATGRFI